MRVYILERATGLRRQRLLGLLRASKTMYAHGKTMKNQADSTDKVAMKHFFRATSDDSPSFERDRSMNKFVSTSRLTQSRDKEASRHIVNSARAKLIAKKFAAGKGTARRAKHDKTAKFFNLKRNRR